MRRATLLLPLPLVAALAAAVLPASASAGTAPLEAKIINGHAVTPARYSAHWSSIAAVVNRDADNQFDGQGCAGTLIDERHVLTAAHCVVDTVEDAPTPNRASTRSLGVVLGRRVLSMADMGSGSTGLRSIANIYVHPRYRSDRPNGTFDMAVLQLAEPVTHVPTMSLATPEESTAAGVGSGGTAYIAGWGNMDPDGFDFPQVLQEVTVPLRSNAICGSRTAPGGYGPLFSAAYHVCAGRLGTRRTFGVDSCQGDSGGPLTVPVGGGRRLAGITSWGIGCGEDFYGLYTNVARLRGWVDSIPGATDDRVATAGPNDLRAVTAPTGSPSGYRSVNLSWTAPSGGATPAEYAIWARLGPARSSIEVLLGTSEDTSAGVRAAPTRSGIATRYVIRPVDAAGSHGPETLVAVAPRSDTMRPGRPGAMFPPRRTGSGVVLRWRPAVDRQTGIGIYQVQRMVGGRWRGAGTTTRPAMGMRMKAGSTVRVRMRARDRAGNWGAWRVGIARR